MSDYLNPGFGALMGCGCPDRDAAMGADASEGTGGAVLWIGGLAVLVGAVALFGGEEPTHAGGRDEDILRRIELEKAARDARFSQAAAHSSRARSLGSMLKRA